jgi:hypothetical protein
MLSPLNVNFPIAEIASVFSSPLKYSMVRLPLANVAKEKSRDKIVQKNVFLMFLWF